MMRFWLRNGVDGFRVDVIWQLIKDAEFREALPPGAWPNWVLGNHDRPRVASRAGAGAGRRDAAVDAARNADALLWRRDRHASGRDCARAQVRDPFEKNVPGIGVGRDGC